jgi:hypothetical protein
MKMANGISEQVNDQSLLAANGLANVQKRLTLLYPGSHELKMTTEQEMYIVFLTIRLEDPSMTVDEKEDKLTVLKYASE